MKSLINKVRRNKIAKIVLVVSLILFSNSIYAQDVAVGQATANVLTGLAVTAVQDLNFGDVLQGVAKSVARTVDANVGIFSINGNLTSGISIYLSLPVYIALADGSDRMTIAFSTTDGAIDQNNATPSTVTGLDGFIDQDPHNLPAGIVVGTGGLTRVYIGGRVTPTVDQKNGVYAGSIICNVAYNGL